MALNVTYFRTWSGNFRVTANQAVAATNFDSNCITAPVDARLGQSSGKQLCGLYDLKPAKFGLVDNLVTQAAHYGKQSEVYNGFDFAAFSGWRGGAPIPQDCADLRAAETDMHNLPERRLLK